MNKILRAKTRSEIAAEFRSKYGISSEQWKGFIKYMKIPFSSKWLPLWWGIPMLVLGVAMAASLFSTIPGSDDHGMIVIRDLDSTEVILMDTLAYIMNRRVAETDSTFTVKEALVVRTPPKEKVHLPLIYKKTEVNFFRRIINIFFNGIIMVLSGLFVVIPIVTWVNKYSDDEPNHYGGY